MAEITSIKDEHITLARSLKSRKGRLQHHKILLEGEQIIQWALTQNLFLDFVLTAEVVPEALAVRLAVQDCPVFHVSQGILKKVTDTKYLIPLVAVADVPDVSGALGEDLILVLDDVKDLGNVGTIIRTCQAFGIHEVINTTADFDLFQRKIIEASRGSVFSTNLRNFSNPVDTLSYLKSTGYQIIATSPRGQNLQSLIELKPQPVALVVGNESDGINPVFEEAADFLVQIPMMPEMESLNVGVATGISIYEIKLKQVLAMIEQQIKSTLGRELNVASMLVQRALDAELSRVTEMTSQQAIFMMVLKCDEHMAVPDMCRQFGILESDADAFLSPLLYTGLVVKDNEKLLLTEKGQENLAKLWPLVERTEDQILSSFSNEERSVFIHHLQQVQKACTDIIAEKGKN